MSAVLLGLVAGWLIADLASGFLHWLEDRVLWVGMPLLSTSIVEPNRLHHEEPVAFTRATIWSRSSTTWAVVLPIAVLWFWIGGFSFVWLGATLGGLVVNEVHALAHRGAQGTGGFLRVLQQVGAIQSPEHHSGHHRANHDRRYCILTNWVNPWLDWLRCWDRLESALTAIGLEPNRGTK